MCIRDSYVTPDLSAFPALEAQYSHLYTDMPEAPCPDNQYLFLSGNLTAEIDGYLSAEDVLARFGDDPLIPDVVKAQGGVLAYIHPSRIVTTGTTVYPILTPIAANLTQAVMPAHPPVRSLCVSVMPVTPTPRPRHPAPPRTRAG